MSAAGAAVLPPSHSELGQKTKCLQIQFQKCLQKFGSKIALPAKDQQLYGWPQQKELHQGLLVTAEHGGRKGLSTLIYHFQIHFL